jgi:hypothetical protein
MNDNDPSVLRNMHEDLPPVVVTPLVGEVKAGASDPSQTETVSVLANMPDHSPIPVAAALEGEVAAGASQPGEVPPSVLGTSQAPKE